MKKDRLLRLLIVLTLPGILFSQSGEFMIKHRVIELTTQNSSTPGNMQVEMGALTVKSGNTSFQVDLVAGLSRANPNAYYASLWQYIGSNLFTVPGGQTTITFEWGFLGHGLNYILLRDSVLDLQFQFFDYTSGKYGPVAMVALLNSNSTIYDTSSQQYVNGFILKGTRKFVVDSISGHQLVGFTSVNVSAIVDSSLLRWTVGDVGYAFLDTTDWQSYWPFAQTVLPSVVSNFALSTPRDVFDPTSFQLEQNYPNPFNPSTRIRFNIPSRSRVRLSVFNLLGQQVAELADKEMNPGSYERMWNANVASGLYFYRFEAASVTDPGKRFVEVKKMVLIK